MLSIWDNAEYWNNIYCDSIMRGRNWQIEVDNQTYFLEVGNVEYEDEKPQFGASRVWTIHFYLSRMPRQDVVMVYRPTYRLSANAAIDYYGHDMLDTVLEFRDITQEDADHIMTIFELVRNTL